MIIMLIIYLYHIKNDTYSIYNQMQIHNEVLFKLTIRII